MSWFFTNYYNNSEFKNVKCKYCGTEIIFNRNIKSRDGQIKPINLDHSPHNCCKLNQERSYWL